MINCFTIIHSVNISMNPQNLLLEIIHVTINDSRQRKNTLFCGSRKMALCVIFYIFVYFLFSPIVCKHQLHDKCYRLILGINVFARKAGEREQTIGSKLHKEIVKKCQYYFISLPYLESPWKMHSNKYKHS